MDALVTDNLLKILMISITFSVIEMALIQKIKSLSFLKKSWQVIILNFIFSFTIGALFGIWFFNLNVYDSLWLALFAFIGAPTIYEALKKQNMINYTPKSIDETITISKDNEIKRS